MVVEPKDSLPEHTLASLVPMMEEEALAEMAESIRRDGLLQPIVLDREGRIVDGRNRLDACQRAGVEPRYVEFQGSDPLNFVLEMNILRRHLNKSQSAILAGL